MAVSRHLLANMRHANPQQRNFVAVATDKTPLLPALTPSRRRRTSAKLLFFGTVVALIGFAIWTSLKLNGWRVPASGPPIPPDPYEIAVIGKRPMRYLRFDLDNQLE
jgi:hypothetical protein